MSKELSYEVFKEVLPKNMKKVVTQEVVDEINKLVKDPDYGEELKSSMISATNVLAGKENWSLKQYIDAVKFYSLTAAAMTQTDAYCKVFPDRLQNRLDRGETKNDMNGEASRYNSSELVNRIRNQALVPLHLVNQSTVQLAINTLTHLMINAKSDVAKVSAASALLKELRPPEAQKIQLDVGINTTDSIAELRKATEELALQQMQSIQAGMAVKYIAESRVIDIEVNDE